MPFAPFTSFDPDAPRGNPAPALWLRRHARPWAFQPDATRGQIDAYALWLHMIRVGAALAERERALRPPIFFRLRLALHRLHFYLRCAGGNPPPEALRDLEKQEQEERDDDE